MVKSDHYIFEGFEIQLFSADVNNLHGMHSLGWASETMLKSTPVQKRKKNTNIYKQVADTQQRVYKSTPGHNLDMFVCQKIV